MAGGGVNLGTGFVTIVPEIKDVPRLTEQALAPVGAQARRAGEEAGGQLGAGLESSTKKLLLVMASAFAATKIIGFFTESARAASGLAESSNALGQIFKDGAKQVEAFGSTAAKNIGQSNLEARNAAATFGAFGKSAGLAGTDLVKFSTDFVTLASDMASFKDTTPEQAIQAIGSALRGESEPIRAYNVLLDDATLRQQALSLGLIATTKEALTPQQKVLAASAEIWKQTTDIQGDYAETSGSVANQERTTIALFKDTQAAIGVGLLPAWAKLLEVGRDTLPILEGVGVAVGGVITFLTDIPGPVYAAAAAFAGMVVLTNVATWATGAIVALGGISAAIRTAGAGLLGILGGGWGIALGAAAAAVAFFALSQGDATVEVADFSDAVDTQTGALKDNATELLAQKAATSGALDAYEALGGATDDWVAGLAGAPDAQARVNKVLDDTKTVVGGALVAMGKYGEAIDSAGKPLAGFEEGTALAALSQSELSEQWQAADGLSRVFAESLTQIAGKQSEGAQSATAAAGANEILATATGEAALTTEELAKALDAEVKAAKEAAEGTGLSDAMAYLKGATDDADRALQLLTATMQGLDGTQRGLDDSSAALSVAQSELGATFGDSEKAATINRGALEAWDVASLNATDAGAGLYSQLTDLADEHAAVTAATYTANVATDGSTVAAGKARDAAHASYEAFVDLASQFLGGNVPAAQKIAAELGILDGVAIDDKTFETIAEDQKAQQALRDLEAKQIADKEFAAKALLDDSAIRNYRPPTIVIPSRIAGPNVAVHEGGAIGRYDDGGATPDFGSYTQDNQWILAHRGEHMFDADDVKAMGGQSAVYKFREALHAPQSSPMSMAAGLAGRGGQQVVVSFQGDGAIVDIIRQYARVEIVEATDREANRVRSYR